MDNIDCEKGKAEKVRTIKLATFYDSQWVTFPWLLILENDKLCANTLAKYGTDY